MRLPDGSRLTVERLQSIGGMLGQSAGSHELHYLLEDPWDGDGGLSDAFLGEVMQRTGFARAPLYAVLHEACYAQGAATRWAAQRVRAEFPAFDPAGAVDGDQPLFFTGEMIYPWMLDLDPALTPLREAAELLAQRDGWPPLYDPARLAANEVPAVAAVYFDDLYVPAPLSLRHRRGHPRAADLGDQRVGARRTADQRRPGARPPDRDAPRRGVTRQRPSPAQRFSRCRAPCASASCCYQN